MNAFYVLSLHQLAGVLVAQSTEQKKMFEGLLWMGATILALVFAGALVTYFRKRMVSHGEGEGPDFSLDELRRLKEAGSLTQAEYEVLKKRAISEFALDEAKKPR